jgi:hypothetical protein
VIVFAVNTLAAKKRHALDGGELKKEKINIARGRDNCSVYRAGGRGAAKKGIT